MRKLLLLAIILTLSGCVVSKQTYQTQYLETRELEAKNEELSADLSDEKARTSELTAELEQLTEELASAKRENEHTEAALAEVRQRLERSQTTREDLGTELDVSKKTVRTAGIENEQLRSLMEKEREAFEGEIKRLEGEIDERDSRIEELRSSISTLKADRDVLNEQNELLEREKREKIDEMSKTYEGLLGTMEDEIRQGRVTISKLEGQLTVNLVDEILFPSGSAEVKEEGKDVLARVAEALIGMEDKAVVIEGHTDDVPIIGGLAHRFPTNWELSTARAVSIVRYLSDTAELDPTRLSAVGFGEYHPVSENDTEEGRAKNRRIEIKLMPIEVGSEPPVQGEESEVEDSGAATPSTQEGEEAVNEEATSSETEEDSAAQNSADTEADGQVSTVEDNETEAQTPGDGEGGN